MRKIGEKVALVAQICVAIIFVIVAMLYVAEIIPQNVLQDNTILFVMMAVLAIIFAGTSVYLVYMSFSEAQNIKRILLHADSKSATTTNVKVVNKIALSCADRIDGVHIKKIKIRADEKRGFEATFVVGVSASSVTPVIEQLRCLIEDSFKDTLGLTFNTITFEVAKIKQAKADIKKAQKRAKALTDGTEQVQDLYQNPTGEKPTDISLPLPAESLTLQSAGFTTDEPFDEQVDDFGQHIDETQTDTADLDTDVDIPTVGEDVAEQTVDAPLDGSTNDQTMETPIDDDSKLG